MTDALDVAAWQGFLDGSAMAAGGCRRGIVKLTEGTYHSNPVAADQLGAFAGAGIPVGGYHFALGGNPEAEADTYLGRAQVLGLLGMADVVHALDLEPYPGVGWPLDVGGTLDFTARWCDRVATNVPPGHVVWWYSYPSFVASLLPPDGRIDRYGCWIADPTAWEQGFPPRTGGRPWVLWQTGVGEFPGVVGAVDLNVFGSAYDQPTPPPPMTTLEDTMLIRRAEAGTDAAGNPQPIGHTEILDGFGGEWHEESYDALVGVPSVSNLVWDEIHARARTRGAQLASAAASGQAPPAPGPPPVELPPGVYRVT